MTSPAGFIFEICNPAVDDMVDCDMGAKKLLVVEGGGGDCKSLVRIVCGIFLCAKADTDVPDTLAEVGNSCKPANKPSYDRESLQTMLLHTYRPQVVGQVITSDCHLGATQ